MRIYIFIWCCLISTLGIQAQKDIELIKENKDNQVLIYAKNNTNEALEVHLSADIKGYSSDAKFPVIKNVAANSKDIILTLTAAHGVENSYQLSVSYTKAQQTKEDAKGTDNTRFTGIEINPTKINVFTKDGCGRCAYVIKYLTDNNIPFLELNTSKHHPNNQLMFEKLGEAGFKGGSVTMPVIYYKEELYYNIKDMPALLKSME